MGEEEGQIWARDGVGGGGPPSTESNHVIQRDVVNDGRAWQPGDRKQRRGQRYWCHVSAERIPPPPSVLTRPDAPRSLLPSPPDSSKQSHTNAGTWALCGAARAALPCSGGGRSVSRRRQEQRRRRPTGPWAHGPGDRLSQSESGL